MSLPRGKSCFMGIRKLKLILYLVAYVLQMCIIILMNRAQRRAQKSKKGTRYRGLSKRQVLTPDSWR